MFSGVLSNSVSLERCVADIMFFAFIYTPRLKETIEEERKKHQDMMSDIERAALQEKERLRKEMAVRIEETKIQMLHQMDEQLHAVRPFNLCICLKAFGFVECSRNF